MRKLRTRAELEERDWRVRKHKKGRTIVHSYWRRARRTKLEMQRDAWRSRTDLDRGSYHYRRAA